MAKKLIVKVKPERNEFVAAMRMRKSGAHGKTRKAQRRGDKVKWKREL